MQKNVIIVAGGSGTRMGTELPKQFLPLMGKPVLMHTINRFYQFDKNITIIVVLPAQEQERWTQLCTNHQFNIKHKTVNGGATRFHSVKNGLALATDGLIAIHDAVRPLVALSVISNCFRTAATNGTAIPVVPINETIRLIKTEGSQQIDRNMYRAVQTPQVFEASLIKSAYQQNYQEHFTDDASVVESDTIKIELVEGNTENIKITTPIDLAIAEVYLNKFEAS